MSAVVDLVETIRYLKRLLIVVLLLNGIAVVYLTIVFKIHRTDAEKLPSPDRLALVEQVLRTQPADIGRQNATDLLRKTNKSLDATIEIVRYGFYCVASLLMANVLIAAMGARKIKVSFRLISEESKRESES